MSRADSCNLTTGAIQDRVGDFYRKFNFPFVRPFDRDGLILMRRLKRRGARSGGGQLRILDAGCGTGNTVLSLVEALPDAKFLGVDASVTSLDIARQRAVESNATNVRFREWNLMDSGLEGGPFDVVLCLGVLHHTPDMERVLSNLVSVLKPDGELYLWVYGRFGRYRHRLNQRLLRMLIAAEPTNDPVAVAKEFLFDPGQLEPIDDLVGTQLTASTWEKVFVEPAWVADQYLHPHEEMLEMESLVDLAARSQTSINEWLGVDREISNYFVSSELISRYRALGERQGLLALDLLLKPDHYFVLLLRDQKQTLR